MKFYKRLKYIKIAYYFIKEAIRNNKIKVFYIKLENNITNFFTKPLSNIKFNNFKNQLFIRFLK